MLLQLLAKGEFKGLCQLEHSSYGGRKFGEGGQGPGKGTGNGVRDGRRQQPKWIFLDKR
jgi:hypothetical protein